MIHAYYVPAQNLFVFTGSVGNSRRAAIEQFLRRRWVELRCIVSPPRVLPHEGLSAWITDAGEMKLRFLEPHWSDVLDHWVSVPVDQLVPNELANLLRDAVCWERLNETGLA